MRTRGTNAVVLAFELDRDWLASLEALCFVLPDKPFYDLVEDCRSGVAPHQRPRSPRTYDVVYGPVTLWPQDMIVAGADQLSIHTVEAASAIPEPVVFDVGTDVHGGLFTRANT
jgi:hypothetical protein